jgi:undecaprenyl diphosphate synthase
MKLVRPSVLAEAVVPDDAQPALPRHVAIIMDGNGRWASARHLPRVAGHRAGAQAVRRTIEVTDLTGLLRHYLRHEVAELHRENVRLRAIGDRARFGPEIARELAEAEALTAENTRLNLTVALSYGGRSEIVAAAKAVAEAVSAGTMKASDLSEGIFSSFLFTAGMPDPDLVIRTSGERRVSNFLLWQAAYAEYQFPEVLWPDFSATHFDSALADYATRDRRYGARPEA